MDNSNQFRQQLVHQILGGNAYKKIEDILEQVDFELLGKTLGGLPYTFWQQFEHLRITQKDILDFSSNTDYLELDWPKDYWPADRAPKNLRDWQERKEMFFADRNHFVSLILNKQNDLSKPFDHGNGQTLFREALLILEHNSYHIGQMMILLRLMQNNSYG